MQNEQIPSAAVALKDDELCKMVSTWSSYQEQQKHNTSLRTVHLQAVSNGRSVEVDFKERVAAPAQGPKGEIVRIEGVFHDVLRCVERYVHITVDVKQNTCFARLSSAKK